MESYFYLDTYVNCTPGLPSLLSHILPLLLFCCNRKQVSFSQEVDRNADGYALLPHNSCCTKQTLTNSPIHQMLKGSEKLLNSWEKHMAKALLELLWEKRGNEIIHTRIKWGKQHRFGWLDCKKIYLYTNVIWNNF